MPRSFNSTSVGKKPAKVLPPPVGAISSAERPALAFAQQRKLMRTHLPTAAGEPADEDVRQLRRGAKEISSGFHGIQCPATTINPGTGTPFSVRVDAKSRLTGFKPDAAKRGSHMRFTMSVTQGVAQNDAAVFVRLDAERQLSRRSHHLRNGAEDSRKVVEVHENIGRKHKVIVAADFRFAGQKSQNLLFDQAVVETLCTRLHQHS